MFAPMHLRKLPRLDLERAPFGRVLAARRSMREYGSRALTAEELSLLLWAGQGITSRDGERTAPSAGAIYPITLSVADGEGLWRYVPGGHTLDLVARGDRRGQLAAAAAGQEFVAGAPVIIAISGRPAALAGRYGRRAERYCTLEAGHVAQNVLLAATALGLGAVPVGAFEDTAVLATLELESRDLALYLVPVGAHRGG